MTGELNLSDLLSAMEDWIESDPLIVTGLSLWGKASVPTSQILYSNTKSKMTCYLAAYAKNCYHSSPRDHWVGERD